MPEITATILFRSPTIFTGDTGTVDQESYIIRGVSVITGNLIAEGHNLHVDDTTLKQLQTCAKAKGKIPVNLDHGTGVKDLNGYLTAFRMDGDKLRADWHLLKTHDESPMMMERAEVMPDCFGLSVAFKGPPQGVAIGGGKMAARCEKLLSVDCVTRPAANDGLFSVPEVDNSKKGMPKEIPAAEPTLAEIMAELKAISGRQDKQDEFNKQVVDQFNGSEDSDQPTLEDFANATDEELAAFNKASGTNITRAEINAAVTEANEAIANGDPDGSEADEAAGANAAAASTAVDASAPGAASPGVGVGVGAELSALRKQVVALENKNKAIELKATKDAEDHELSEIEEKVVIIATQRDKAIELAEKAQAEVTALRLHIKTGTRPVAPGIDTGVRIFSANGNGQLHKFQSRVKEIMLSDKKTEGQAVVMAQKEDPASHADWVQSLNPKVSATE